MKLDVEQTISQLTLQEKAALCSGSDLWHTQGLERLGIPRLLVSDGPHGVRTPGDEAGDHLGLGDSLPATCFPPAVGLAATWDPDLLTRVGEALGDESRALGVSVLLGPGVNIKRSPLCGRNFEYFSEDPYLAGELGLALVKGIQSRGVGTSLKHFAANNQETDRLRISAEIDERTLREIYLPAFERIVTGAQPWTVMCAYNKINGTYAAEHHELLTTILREEWGFDGLVVSDWGAVHDRVASVAAGLDLEMPPDLEHSPAAVVAAVESGELSPEALDASVRRVLQLVDRALTAREELPGEGAVGHHTLAREAAGRAVVLLKNDGALLPLDPEGGATVAVVGEFARTPRYQGAGSSQVNPTEVDTALDAMRAVYGDDNVIFAPGFRLDGPEDRHDVGDLGDQAVEAASEADVVVAFLGLPGSVESEGFDRADMDLPAEQLDLLSRLVDANPNVVVVLSNGSAVTMADGCDRVPALVEAWLGGQASGSGVVDVLSGAVNPSGRLAETIPLRLADNSAALNFPGDSGRVRYGEGIFVGYRAHDQLQQDVAFPFGYGLSYTTFELSELRVDLSGSVEAGDLSARVRVTVTNTGDRAGADVVQVYVHDPESAATRPPRELKGFGRIALAPGESGEVALTLDQRAFSYWSDLLHRFVVEPGDVDVEVGHHSRDLPLSQRVRVAGPSVAAPLTAESTVQEWRSDPDGAALLADLMARGATPMPDLPPELAAMVASMPMSSVAAFPMSAFGPSDLAEAVREWRRRTGRGGPDGDGPGQPAE